MSLAVIHTRALVGLHAPDVVVEVHLANGLPSFTLVGLADTEVKEARERVRAALAQSGFAFPHNKKITVNLAPADLPKVTTRSLIANLVVKCERPSLCAKPALCAHRLIRRFQLHHRLAGRPRVGHQDQLLDLAILAWFFRCQ